jgi:large repetitive protein
MLGLERGVIQGRVFIDLNGNGNDDADEPGIAGMKVQIDGDRSATTDQRGGFRFQINSGGYSVALISEEVGSRWRASTPTEQRVSVLARQTTTVSFGLSNFGSVEGRVFNNLSETGDNEAGSQPGVTGVSVSLVRRDSSASTRTVGVDGIGGYRFSNVPPGSYTLELDLASLPADFQVPTQTSWVVTVAPLQNFYLDLPLSAQRSISGIVFIDQDGDGKFDPEKDQRFEGARVMGGKTAVTSGKGGNYILRNLPAGKIVVRAGALQASERDVVTIELSQKPVRINGVNLAINR